MRGQCQLTTRTRSDSINRCDYRDPTVLHVIAKLLAANVDQAIERAGVKLGNKGFEAATVAVELANLYKEAFEKGSDE